MGIKAGSKVPVSVRAIVQRINRVLQENDRQLKAARGGRALQACGRFYVINVKSNTVVQHNVDLSELAQELGTIKPFEALVIE
jgi:hypothetical protein